MVLSKPQAHFAHQRTVRLIVDDDIESIDALKIAKSLPEYSGAIKGIVPLFGGKCFDITLASREAAAKLAQEGIDYEQVHKPLRLLGQRSIHVSVFVSVEFPDEDLLNLLATYGELKSRSVRRLFFTEEGFTHIENGIRVVQFNKIEHNIPKRVVLGGLEIGFKYSGQPVTCHRCHSTEHVVKNCPKRRERPPPPPSAESDPPGDGMDTSTPRLFTQSETATYASAASETERQETDEDLRAWGETMRREEEAYVEELRASRGRKRDLSSPSQSDDEQGAPSKKSMASETSPVNPATPPDNEENTEDSAEASPPEENQDSTESAAPTDQEPATPPPQLAFDIL